MTPSNIVLIGMAAAGKSTVGRHLARNLGWAFVDTDHLLEAWWGAPLQHITDHLGRTAFVQAEADQIQRLNLFQCIIATGGSVVYSDAAMCYLDQIGAIVYLESSYETIAQRLTNPGSRGLAISKNQTLRDLYDERVPLYQRFARLTVSTDRQPPRETCKTIVQNLVLQP